MQILQGEKFSGPFASTFIFFFPVLLNYSLNIKQRLKIITFLKISVPIGVFIGIATALILIQYQEIHVGDPFELFKLRVAAQGQVWWGIDAIVYEGLTSKETEEQLYKELFDRSPAISGESSEKGLNFLMELISPSEVIEGYFERGVRFSMGYPAITLFLFGYLGVLLSEFLIAPIFIILLVYAASKILKGHVLRAFICLRVILIPLEDVFLMGEFYRLFRVEVFAYIVMLILLEGFALMKIRINNSKIQ